MNPNLLRKRLRVFYVPRSIVPREVGETAQAVRRICVLHRSNGTSRTEHNYGVAPASCLGCR
jgi:hypothetical protein